jgi:hypothetical protein
MIVFPFYTTPFKFISLFVIIGFDVDVASSQLLTFSCSSACDPVLLTVEIEKIFFSLDCVTLDIFDESRWPSEM